MVTCATFLYKRNSGTKCYVKNIGMLCSLKCIRLFADTKENYTVTRLLSLVGKCSRCGEGKYAYEILVGKPGEKRPLARRRNRWKDNVKLDFKGCEVCEPDLSGSG